MFLTYRICRAHTQGRGWTISPTPFLGDDMPAGHDEGSVRVDLQLVLPSAAAGNSRMISKVQKLPSVASDSSISSRGSRSSRASSYSSVPAAEEEEEEGVGAVVLDVTGGDAQAAAAAAGPSRLQQSSATAPEAAAAAAATEPALQGATMEAIAARVLQHHSSQSSSVVIGDAVASSAGAVDAADAGEDVHDDDEGLCTICYDQQATCVLMECGHGGYCWRCAHVLFARPPSECPACRQPIMQVSELLTHRKAGRSSDHGPSACCGWDS